MSFKKHGRQFDLVVLGATGYTGELTTQFIAQTFPAHLRWAIAGRSSKKLQAVASALRSPSSSAPPPEIEICTLDDSDSMAALASKTFCLITTLGPFARFGEPAFRACAENGTHYMDCTPEVPWVKLMIEQYEAAAKKSGACLFPQSGLESAPSDVLAFALASTTREKLDCYAGDVIVDMTRLDSSPTGGTMVSLIGILELFTLKQIGAALKPYAMSPAANDAASIPRKSTSERMFGTTVIPGLGRVTTSATGPLNSTQVWRTWGLHNTEDIVHNGKKLYGPKFAYREYVPASNAIVGVVMHVGLLVALGALLLPPVRALVKKMTFKPGEGPDTEKAKTERIEFKAMAIPDVVGEQGKGKYAYATFGYTGGMYYLTAVQLSQMALTMLRDEDVKLAGGVYTPACLGQGFVDRLKANGVELETEIRSF
jgi:short subunit dehydrogenase-like uncharacterized protein